MKSVGEIHGYWPLIRRSDPEGIRMVGLGMHGFVGNKGELASNRLTKNWSTQPTAVFFAIAEAFNKGVHHRRYLPENKNRPLVPAKNYRISTKSRISLKMYTSFQR
jgi:hypothetical protein